jgi:hypothetical protein
MSDLPALAFFKALADESRLRLLGVLASRPASVEELAAILALKEPTVSHHLGRLRALGLVTMRPEGTRHLYSLDPARLRALARDSFAGIEAPSPDPSEGAWERKVLATYLRDGRLTELPASRKKRRLVLAELARQFPEGETIPEKTLNARLAEWHTDTATIRREFIGYRMMTRADGIYTRLPEPQWHEEADMH